MFIFRIDNITYLLSGPSSLLTASRKHSWSSGVHLILGLWTAAGPDRARLGGASIDGATEAEFWLHVNPTVGVDES